ncbi:hypothetical protein IFM89_015319 [Coptis chinensis]|uniref:Uncharacterized protein n=1 Tax=Coptis chinensis TaxID=261450 RepID=A0A835IQN6_9MAGN|nr:hypothetical protein IFM89_015319 [Coptis chinensis]
MQATLRLLEDLYGLFVSISASMTMHWCVCGDFNSILSSVERYGCAPRPPRDMEDFIDLALTQPVRLIYVLTIFPWTINSRFCNAWALHNSFHEVVKNAWEQTIGGNPILVLNVKLKRLKGVLKDWSKTNFSDIHARTEGS